MSSFEDRLTALLGQAPEGSRNILGEELKELVMIRREARIVKTATPSSKTRQWAKKALGHPQAGKFGAILAGAAAVAGLWAMFGDKDTAAGLTPWGSGHAGLVGNSHNRRHTSRIVDQRTRYGGLFPMAANVTPEPHYNVAARTAYSGGSYA